MAKVRLTMIRGMTGYGRVTCRVGPYPLTLSIRSVNRRSFELTCYLPASLVPLEGKIRPWVMDRVHRGHLQLHIEWLQEAPLAANLPLIKELRTAAEVIADEAGLPFPEAYALACRGKEGLLVGASEREIDEGALKEGLDEVLTALVLMREEEGRAIAADLLKRLQHLESLLQAVGKRCEGTADRVRSRLIERLKGWEIEDARLIKEVALYAEKADTTEEVVRFHHHLKALTERVRSEEPAQGKVCEFIVQEMVREANTMGAKAQDAEAQSLVVEVKGELERLREQLQNVE